MSRPVPGTGYTRLTNYARLSALQLVLGLVALAGGAVTLLLSAPVVAVTVVLVLRAWGPFQTHVTFNPQLDETGRARWRIALWIVPGSMALYWRLHVRPGTAE